MKQKKPVVLVILDGFGHRLESEHNAIAQADTPTLDALQKRYPHFLLNASGSAVGLRVGDPGNSEVGHMTIAAGRIIKQPALFLQEAIADKSFFHNKTLQTSLQKVTQGTGVLHIMGLLSDAGIHSIIELVYAYLDAAHQHGINHVFIHPFLDGRDSPPRSAATYLQPLDDALTALEYGSIGSIHGRFYAMDRDHHWQRTEYSYRALTDPDFESAAQPWDTVLDTMYAQHITDEFVPPTRLNPLSTIQNGDGIIFFNFRPDRARQLTAAFVDPSFNHFPRQHIKPSCFITPVPYADHLHTQWMYPAATPPNTLKEIISQNSRTIFSIAETEKYAHVTYFFGGIERGVPGEKTIMVPSLPLNTYAEHPTMQADIITKTVIESLQHGPDDFYIINYANADMVGHSGNMHATIKAVECLDHQIKILYEQVVNDMDGILIIVGDHGKAEEMIDADTQKPKTAHTTNQVPCIIINAPQTDQMHSLKDVAPFILHCMDIKIPQEMSLMPAL